jgi:hypothetical protein
LGEPPSAPALLGALGMPKATGSSSTRAPSTSSRFSGSFTSSPAMTSLSSPAFRETGTGSVMTAVRVEIAEPLS